MVAWLKAEMRLMLDEELARAILIGDGRDVDDEDKIHDPKGATDGAGIRSILNDDDLYAATITSTSTATSRKTDIVDEILESHALLQGLGLPTFYTTLPVMTQMLLATRHAWAAASTARRRTWPRSCGVAKIVTVEVMEDEPDLVGIIVNLQDYTVGADRGGEVSLFDDFDIDYNQYKYLIETRVVGRPHQDPVGAGRQAGRGGRRPGGPGRADVRPGRLGVTITDTTGVTYRRGDTNAAVTAAGSPYTVDEGVGPHHLRGLRPRATSSTTTSRTSGPSAARRARSSLS